MCQIITSHRVTVTEIGVLVQRAQTHSCSAVRNSVEYSHWQRDGRVVSRRVGRRQLSRRQDTRRGDGLLQRQPSLQQPGLRLSLRQHLVEVILRQMDGTLRLVEDMLVIKF